MPPKAARPLISNDATLGQNCNRSLGQILHDQNGVRGASSARTPKHCSVLPPVRQITLGWRSGRPSRQTEPPWAPHPADAMVSLSLRSASRGQTRNRPEGGGVTVGSSARGEGPEDGNPSIFSLSPSREGRGLGRFTVMVRLAMRKFAQIATSEHRRSTRNGPTTDSGH